MPTTLRLAADFEHDADEVSFLQMIRTWERAHQHVQIAVSIDAPTQSLRQAEEIFNQLDPGFPYKLVVPKK